jgi:periodic tryptophan protein 2
LQIFSIDENLFFSPTDLDVTITPQTVLQAIASQQFTLAINMALQLNEQKILKKAINSVGIEAIELVVKSIDTRMFKNLLKFFANELVFFLLKNYYSVYYNVYCAECIYFRVYY